MPVFRKKMRPSVNPWTACRCNPIGKRSSGRDHRHNAWLPVLPAAGVRLPFGPASKRRKRMPLRRTATHVAAVVVAIVGASAGALAQTPEQFYAGKAIDLVIGYPPAGSNDL